MYNKYFQIFVPYLEGGNFIGEKSGRFCSKTRVQGPVVSVRIASDIFRPWASLTGPEPESRGWCHWFVNHGEKTSSKHWALLSLSECEIQSNGWDAGAVALCLAAYTVSDSHQSEQQLRSQALGSCLVPPPGQGRPLQGPHLWPMTAGPWQVSSNERA